MDTGNPGITFMANPETGLTFSPSNAQCLFLSEDDSFVYFVSNSFVSNNVSTIHSCGNLRSPVGIGNLTLSSAYVVAEKFSAANMNLHNWSTSNGDLGLGYSTTGAYTLFQKLLDQFPQYDTDVLPSSSQIFGIDANPHGGSLQLSDLSSEYRDIIEWQLQPTSSPLYHNLIISDLSICNQSLFANYSNNWQVLFDTGSVCITLPAEIFDMFEQWMNFSHPIGDLSLLPALSFYVSNASSPYYIPLSSLVVNASTLGSDLERAPPTFQIGSQNLSFCVLRGSNIENEYDSTSTSYSFSPIIFGTMALHSLYLAADFQSMAVGIASKVSSLSFQPLAPGQGMCSNYPVCFGDQTLNVQERVCKDPTCSNYFFMALDSTTMTCRFTAGAKGFGALFLLIAIFCDVFTYFLLEFSASESLDRSKVSNQFAWKTISPLSAVIGGYLAVLIDWIVIYQLEWAVPVPGRTTPPTSTRRTGVAASPDVYSNPFPNSHGNNGNTIHGSGSGSRNGNGNGNHGGRENSLRVNHVFIPMN